MGLTRISGPTAKLTTMILVFLVSFTLYGLYCYNTVSEVKINGPYYQRIVQSKDVIADILPPPQYLIETYLTAFEMLEARGEGLPGYVAKINRHKSEYLARHAHWQADLPEGELKRALLQGSYLPARRMLDSLERAFIPALQGGDFAGASALLHSSIRKDYLEHRAEIDKVVKLAVRQNEEEESRAGVAVDSRTIGQIVMGVLLFILLSALSWYLLRPPGTKPGPGPQGAGSLDHSRLNSIPG